MIIDYTDLNDQYLTAGDISEVVRVRACVFTGDSATPQWYKLEDLWRYQSDISQVQILQFDI